MPDPIYTPANTTPAYQLNWSYTAFWHDTPLPPSWLPALREASEPDGIRVLQHTLGNRNSSQFLLSTRPHVAPVLLVTRVKGRLQHLVRAHRPKAFQRNYSLRSVGSTTREKLQSYLETQADHHPMADPKVQDMFQRLQVRNPQVDLAAPRFTAHGQYWYNLHVVMVNDLREPEIHEETLLKMRDMIVRASAAKGHLLSHGAILADHVHLTLGCQPELSPLEVALSYMNNLCFACGMRRLFKFSCFVGTFGEYDLGVIPRG